MKRDAATQAQVRAADPMASTWLSANAGSGKTRVLTDRVARLLLSGVSPQHILCLTYTKAAASEMQNRLFKRLGEWAMLDQNQLRTALERLGLEQSLNDDVLREARRLFARAIETPGGLKIQTIHSFCAALLRRFPLEAGVSPQFVEMDDRAANRLRDDVLEALSSGSDTAAMDALAQYFPGDDLGGILQEIAKHRDAFGASAAEIWQLFDLPEDYAEDQLISDVFLGTEAGLFNTLIPAMRAGTKTDVANAEKLARLLPDLGSASALPGLEALFLFGKSAKSPFGAKIGKFPNKAVLDTLPGRDALEDLMRRVEDTRPKRLALAAARKTLALHQFAAGFLPEYDRRKRLHGWLDFDDLIIKARDLLTNPGVAEWVLYRLDGGIDHILVDEAQDTSPLQWQVVELLSREFTAGEGAHADTPRTIFVVGDKKQSIYSFQGADPDGFDRMRDTFAGRLRAAPVPLSVQQLEFSFRSAPAILNVVDTVFGEGRRAGMGDSVLHRAFRQDLPGRVDLWPVTPKEEKPDDLPWYDPVNRIAPSAAPVRLADDLAARIKEMIGAESLIENGERRDLRAGDVLILVRRRSTLFHEIICACKAAGLPVAGADRLKIGGELAVKDLTAMLAFLSTPEDNLSLAAALRSPLFGWDEARIYNLAAGRSEKYLWATLRARSDEFGAEHDMLQALRDEADYLRPFELLERILTRHDGRRKLIARLGEEAEDGIDALLAQALSYERSEIPSLTGFLGWLQSDEVEIKRELGSAGNRIRVMTVHGAKGLEAPVVILPDTNKHELRIRDEVLQSEGGQAMWKSASDQSPAQVTAALDHLRRKQEEERQRLLYVAMTRAEQWLIVCAAGDLDKGNSWYEKVQLGLTHAGAVTHEFAMGQGLRLQTGDWPGPVGSAATDTTSDCTLPDWVNQPAKRPHKPAPPLSPSNLGGAKALPGDAGLPEDEAKARGTALHLLLEHLPAHPQARWPIIATQLDATDVLAEATSVLTNEKLAPIFAEDALAEVDVTATLPALGNAPMTGTIDRLLFRTDHILAIDYKSNATPPRVPADVPEGLLRQMGAYASALKQIYPGQRIETAILWTANATLMPLPDQLIEAALARATTS